MNVRSQYVGGQRPTREGFTLIEVVICIAIAAISIAGIIWGYVLAANRAEWTLCSSAAQVMASRHLEQIKTARWDSLADELPSPTNFVSEEPLDIPVTGTGVLIGTNTVDVSEVSADPPLRLLRVDCVWSLVSRGPFTNTAFALRSQDQ